MKRGGTAAAALVAATVLAGCTADTENLAEASRDKGAAAPPDAPAPPGYQQGERGTDGPGAKPTGPADFRSTFALDVDTASYGYAARTLRDGARPAPRTVRTEEFVNSFPQGYERPAGDGFSVSADGARTGEEGWSLMRVGLATKKSDPDAPRRPAALTFVLDVSGSMGGPGRLDLVKEALEAAAGELRASDSVSLVTFSGRAETVLPMTRLGDGGRARFQDAVASLKAGSSTDLSAGLRRGYRQAAEHRRAKATNRVVLMSDALANTGKTDAAAILASVERYRKEQGISLFGVGVGSQYGDALMERLTNKGDGHTVYVSTRRQARDVFVNQLPRNVELRAREAKAQVVFDRGAVEEFRLLGYEDRVVADEDFRDDTVDGGEIGPGHTVTALYAVKVREGAEGRAATATVRWLDPDDREPHETSRAVDTDALTGGLVWTTGSAARSEGDGGKVSPYLRQAAVAAAFAGALRREGRGPADAAQEFGAKRSLAELHTETVRLEKTADLRSAAGLAANISRARKAG
ncbi:von Willebrand factor type A domain-containing protein [Streptomyces diacarni]|uniref:vWA domain-containing protein n=1 Tax=Streptomyces diacarni TaxID=2800381 RepID=UPI0033EDA012